jgi:hypothetical protein
METNRARFELGRGGALIEQQDFGEVVAYALPSLFVGAGDRSWSTDRDGGRHGEFGYGRVQSIADNVVAAAASCSNARRKKSARSATWTVDQCCCPVPSMIKLPWSSRGEPSSSPGIPPPLAVRDAGDDHDPAPVVDRKHSAFDRFLPCHQRRRPERRLLGDGGVGTVDPQTADSMKGLPVPAYASIVRRQLRSLVGAGGVTRTGCVDRSVRITQDATTAARS